jgi:hypothetical protein
MNSPFLSMSDHRATQRQLLLILAEIERLRKVESSHSAKTLQQKGFLEYLSTGL